MFRIRHIRSAYRRHGRGQTNPGGRADDRLR
jgi:hypothetical protein